MDFFLFMLCVGASMTEAFFVSGSVGTSGKKILAKKASSVSYTQPSFDELQEGKDQYLVVCYDGCFKKKKHHK